MECSGGRYRVSRTNTGGNRSRDDLPLAFLVTKKMAIGNHSSPISVVILLVKSRAAHSEVESTCLAVDGPCDPEKFLMEPESASCSILRTLAALRP
jgi:hypothetical protein